MMHEPRMHEPMMRAPKVPQTKKHIERELILTIVAGVILLILAAVAFAGITHHGTSLDELTRDNHSLLLQGNANTATLKVAAASRASLDRLIIHNQAAIEANEQGIVDALHLHIALSPVRQPRP